MFTGLVEEVGDIVAVTELPSKTGRRLQLRARLGEETLPRGASIAVDGVCLTVVEARNGQFAVEVGPETMARTMLGALIAGSSVNLERPLRLGDRLGGHMVSGHVDAVGKVARVENRGEATDVTIAAASEILRYVVEKGSIAIDGVSLTVNRVEPKQFSVSLIPHTQSATTLGTKTIGAGVNLEVDVIGKYVEKLIGPHFERAKNANY